MSVANFCQILSHWLCCVFMTFKIKPWQYFVLFNKKQNNIVSLTRSTRSPPSPHPHPGSTHCFDSSCRSNSGINIWHLFCKEKLRNWQRCQQPQHHVEHALEIRDVCSPDRMPRGAGLYHVRFQIRLNMDLTDVSLTRAIKHRVLVRVPVNVP